MTSLRAIVEKSSLGGETAAMETITPRHADDDDVIGDVRDDVVDGVDDDADSTVELEPFKSGPDTADLQDEQLEHIGLIAPLPRDVTGPIAPPLSRDVMRDYVTPVTGFHLRPRPLSAKGLRVDKARDRTAAVSMLLPPDNSPWIIRQDLLQRPTTDQQLLSVDADTRLEDGEQAGDIIKLPPTLSGDDGESSAKAAASSLRGLHHGRSVSCICSSSLHK